jgi:hypothetical protein
MTSAGGPLVLGVLMYVGAWGAHEAAAAPRLRDGAWEGAPTWLRRLLRRGIGPVLLLPALVELSGLAFIAHAFVLAGVLPADPFDSLTRIAITGGIVSLGGAGTWVLVRSH